MGEVKLELESINTATVLGRMKDTIENQRGLSLEKVFTAYDTD